MDRGAWQATRGGKESDMTEQHAHTRVRVHTHTHTHTGLRMRQTIGGV